MYPNRHPLWLPKGSVRGIIALGVIGGGVAMAMLQIPTPEWYALLMGVIGTYYYKSREDDNT